MSARNDITGDSITSKPSNEAYSNGYDLIWGVKKKQLQEDMTEAQPTEIEEEE